MSTYRFCFIDNLQFIDFYLVLSHAISFMVSTAKYAIENRCYYSPNQLPSFDQPTVNNCNDVVQNPVPFRSLLTIQIWNTPTVGVSYKHDETP